MTEIKISELSVGDWISDKNGIVAQVRGIECWSDGYVVNVRTRAGTITALTVEGVCPIPLLPKILDENGFRKNGEYNEWNIGEWDEHPFIGVSLDRQCIRIKHFGNDIYIEGKVVYVHQLQHALRLAGVEKEIEL